MIDKNGILTPPWCEPASADPAILAAVQKAVAEWAKSPAPDDRLTPDDMPEVARRSPSVALRFLMCAYRDLQRRLGDSQEVCRALRDGLPGGDDESDLDERRRCA